MKIYITKITLVFFIAITTVISVHAQTLNVETDHVTYQIPIVQIGEMTFQDGQTTSHEDEDSGNIYIEGGTLQLTTSANGGKCIKSDGMAIICNGTH